jgi:2-oxoisovalerate dehydrogenase E1 component
VETADRERRDLEMYRKLLVTRLFDERVSVLHRQNKVAGGVYSGVGQEAVVVGICQMLREGDLVFPLHRDMGVFLMRGIPLPSLMAQILGRETGLSGGRDSFLHTGDITRGVIGATSMLGATLPVATGAALGFRTRGEDKVAVAFFGEGSTSRGDFHEALNFAGIHKLPVIFVCENNQYAFTTPLRLQMPVETVSERADAYRIKGHSEHDPARYREEDEVVEWGARDPIELYELYLEKRGMDVAKIGEALRAEIGSEIDAAVAFAEASPMPKPEAAMTAVYFETSGGAGAAEVSVEAGAQASSVRPGALRNASIADGQEPPVAATSPAVVSRSLSSLEDLEVTYLSAINRTLAFEMEHDSRILLLGEDIGIGGGAFGVTEGLLDRFGSERVVDTPISESLIIGGSVGAALVGLRPVAEMQFADFITCGFDQFVNSAATMCYRHAGQFGVGMVVRCPAGGRIRGGLFHSQNVESFFLSTPGIKIVAPSNANDASGLLRSAIHDGNPVLFLEYKYLYRREKARLPGGVADAVPIGKAAVLREGSDLTIVTYGPTTPLCREAVELLIKDGHDPELIDLRTIKPLDTDAVLTSLAKTNRLLIVHEYRLFCGLGAEIAARVCESAFHLLEAPVRRVATADTHYAYSPTLEDAILPSVTGIREAALEVLRY